MDDAVRIAALAWDAENRAFTIAMATVFLLGFGVAWLRAPWASGVAIMAPGLCMTIGVLGTFYGILIGLLDFDVSQVADSIPGLLAGMKTAFVTSVTGAFLAVLLKLLQPLAKLRPTARASADKAGATADDIHAVLTQLLSQMRETDAANGERLKRLQEAVGGEGDATLVSQTRLTRQAVSDGFQALSREFREFGEKVSKLGSEAMIEALRTVIADFNKNLTEQFGENFKHLNAAVEKLVVWQVEYRTHLEEARTRLEEQAQGIDGVRRSLAEIAERCALIPDTLERYDTLMKGLLEQEERARAHLEAFAAMRERALDAFPRIERNLEQLTAGFAAAVTAAVAEARGSLAEQQRSFETLREGFAGLGSEVTRVLAEFEAAYGVLHAGTEELGRRHRDHLDRVADQVAAHWRATSEKHRADIQTHMDALRKANEEAVARLTAHLEATVAKMTADVAEASAAGRTLLTDQQRSFESLRDGFGQLRTESGTVSREVSAASQALHEKVEELGRQHRAHLEAAAQEMAQHWRDLNTRHRGDLQVHMDGLRKANEDAIQKQNALVQEQITKLDEALQKELTNVMESFAANMLGLHKHIADAYGPFVGGVEEFLRAFERMTAEARRVE